MQLCCKSHLPAWRTSPKVIALFSTLERWWPLSKRVESGWEWIRSWDSVVVFSLSGPWHYAREAVNTYHPYGVEGSWRNQRRRVPYVLFQPYPRQCAIRAVLTSTLSEICLALNLPCCMALGIRTESYQKAPELKFTVVPLTHTPVTCRRINYVLNNIGSKEGWQRWPKGWSTSPLRKVWENWGSSAWRREGCGETWEYGAYRKDGDRLFSKACFERTRSNGFKLREGRFRLDIGKKFFTVKVVKHWHGLPRKVGDAPSLEPFQARLDGALSTLIRLQMSLLTAGGWARWPLKVPSNPQRSVIRWFYDSTAGQDF